MKLPVSRRLGRAVALLSAALVAALVWLPDTLRRADEPPRAGVNPPAATPQQIERGAYLARAGNCMNCHTARGGAPFAGGRGITTPFGTVYSSNLTPDDETGLGRWSAADFRRALHEGRSRDGRLLYPAFPYPDFTLVTHEDSDALYAWLRTLPAVRRAATPHDLRWPYGTQAALGVWRALYFEPGPFVPDPQQSAQWNRGAYLVQSLGHCAACHAPRDALAGQRDRTTLAGAPMPQQNWYAPSLASPHEAGVDSDGMRDFVQLMRTGTAPRAVALGPMAEVVQHSTQFLTMHDLEAIGLYLQTLPRSAPPPEPDRGEPARSARGARIYDDHCVQCHGEQGQGVRGAYPPLAGNRAVTMQDPTNLVRVVLQGGFAPATTGNPRPFGMPPYLLTLDDAEIAAVLTHLRGAWGNRAPQVSELDVDRIRSNGLR